MYQLSAPVLSAHNLIIGTPYVDCNGKVPIKNLTLGCQAVLEYHLRGWTGHGHKVTGDVYNLKGRPRYKIEGRWNKEIVLIDLRKDEK